MRTTGKLKCLALVAAIGFSATLKPALAGKVHWKEDPAAKGCFALAFDDTDQWFATPSGNAFKKGVCFGQRIKYQVILAPDGETFTALGARSCEYRVGEGHQITATCNAPRSR